MSSRCDLNANGSVLTPAVVRQLLARVEGEFFEASLQQIHAWQNCAPPVQMIRNEAPMPTMPEFTMAGIPLKVSNSVPRDQVWLMGRGGEIVGRIINIGEPT
jgi:hypothetical protein